MTRTPAEAIRRVVDWFADGFWPSRGPDLKTEVPHGLAIAEDTDSIHDYERRYMQLGQVPGIDTELEAQRLADLILARTRKPLWKWEGKDHKLIYDHPDMRNAVGVYWSHAR